MNPASGHRGPVGLVLTPPEAVVVHCSDYRFQAAIQTFLRTITTHSYDLLAVPGGAHFAAAGYFLPKHHAVGKYHLKLLIELHHLKRCILIDHADCAFFKQRLAFFFAEPSLKEKQLANLRKAHAVVQEWFPTLLVDAYFAQAGDERLVDFSRIV